MGVATVHFFGQKKRHGRDAHATGFLKDATWIHRLISAMIFRMAFELPRHFSDL